MPLNAYGWSTEEDEILAELVRPHSILYSFVNDPSRKSILAREAAWADIAQSFVNKPPEECKKRWRGIRDSYMRSKRVGSVHRTKVGVFAKLEEFLPSMEAEPGSEEIAAIDSNEEMVPEPEVSLVEDGVLVNAVEEAVQLQDGTDAQDFVEINSDLVLLNSEPLKRVQSFKYLGHWLTDNLKDNADIERERRALSTRANMIAHRFRRCTAAVKVTVINDPIINDTRRRNVIKILPKPPDMNQIGAIQFQQTLETKKPITVKGRRRKRNLPPPTNTVPVKILPNPINPIIFKPIQYQEQQNTAVNDRTQLIDSIIEKILKESTNEVDVFFKSMAEAVKKMHPSFIPKVKMEVCNVVAKYEMQSIYKKS